MRNSIAVPQAVVLRSKSHTIILQNLLCVSKKLTVTSIAKLQSFSFAYTANFVIDHKVFTFYSIIKQYIMSIYLKYHFPNLKVFFRCYLTIRYNYDIM